jgi:hypothetical protein
MQKPRVVDLLDQEVGHISAGDKPGGPVAPIDQDTIAPSPRSIRENGWTNDRPVESTAANDAFLQILVCVNAAKEEAKRGIVEDAPAATAVPCSQAGHADQALDRAVLHGIDEHPRRGGKELRPGEDPAWLGGHAERLNDGFNAGHRSLNRALVARIAIYFLKIGMIDADRGCGPRQGTHGMACPECSLEGRKANPLACTDDQNGRHWGEYFLRVLARRGRAVCLNVRLCPRLFGRFAKRCRNSLRAD